MPDLATSHYDGRASPDFLVNRSVVPSVSHLVLVSLTVEQIAYDPCRSGRGASCDRDLQGLFQERVVPLTSGPSYSEKQLDLQLFAEIRKGDESALERLYDRHSAAVLGLCTRILGNQSDAEETLVEIFQEIWDRAERFDPDRASPAAYLMTVARSRAIDHLRARNRRSRLLVVPSNDGLLDNQPCGSSSGRSPLEQALSNEVRQQVRQAMLELNPDQRRAIELSFFHGLTQAEIADHLDTPLGTVKTRIRLGLIRIRNAMKPDELDEEVS